MTEVAQTATKAPDTLPEPQNFAGASPAADTPARPSREKLPVIDAHAEELLTPLDTVLTQCWGGLHERDALLQFVNPNNVKQTKKGVNFTLDNGIELIWSASMLQGPDGRPIEFIGVPGKLFGKPHFDQEAADAVVMLAISKGWGSINLHGPVEHQEMMWLTAQKAGMPVTNFAPAPDSAIWKKLEQQSPEAYQRTMQRMLGAPQEHPEQAPAPQPEVAGKKQPAAIASRFAQAEDPFEQALQQRIDQAQTAQEAAGLKQVLDDVRGGKLELDAREKTNLLQKIDSPILLADKHGRTITPVESALALVEQKRAAEKTPDSPVIDVPEHSGGRIEPTLNLARSHPKPPEPK